MRHKYRADVNMWHGLDTVEDLESGALCLSATGTDVFLFVLGFFFLSLSNLFHGMDENAPVRYTVYCSLIKVAAACSAIAFIPTDLDQVRDTGRAES